MTAGYTEGQISHRLYLPRLLITTSLCNFPLDHLSSFQYSESKCIILMCLLRNLYNGATKDFPGSSDDKKSACNAYSLSLIPGSGRPPGEGNSNPIQYSCLENSMDRGARWAIINGVINSWTRLRD